jgi:hypothetical protein
MRVICDDCPILSSILLCQNGYKVEIDKSRKVGRGEFTNPGAYSDSCRLVKIITLDGEILPEEVKE